MLLLRTHFPDLREKLRDEMLCIADSDSTSQFELIGHLYMFVDILTRSAENAGRVITSRLRDFYMREAVNRKIAAKIPDELQNDKGRRDVSVNRVSPREWRKNHKFTD